MHHWVRLEGSPRLYHLDRQIAPLMSGGVRVGTRIATVCGRPDVVFRWDGRGPEYISVWQPKGRPDAEGFLQGRRVVCLRCLRVVRLLAFLPEAP